MTATRPARPITVYSSSISGHSHRVRLFLSLLDLPFETVEVDLRAGEQRRPEFLRRNAFGQVPVIEDGDVTLADSNAILLYLNERYAPDPARWMPRDALGAARVQRWLSVAAGPLAQGPSMARVIVLFGLATDPSDVIARSHNLLRVMEGELGNRPFLAGDSETLADVANYSYVAHVPEGNVSLQDYPKVRQWLQRIEALPGFVPMAASRIGLAA
ncbi:MULTISPECIES: glutathione S-transferase [unclassified Variovorax]|uniref:glutathione S-transferase family protein n=1 Tax=unclassified Variovorax TaxID=663243 RepID=UPI00076CF96E|nr:MULTISPECIES: glutathione S-transferase [unclassified Variovorax]KWT87777.1 Glutathione S-transferase [Variovorax sp. WDL1]PNG59464.1 Disulfide-bond oxidoreductase YfcG [Variovorax sp. B4]PNG60745.1 Disulfide-bond oxidoreductase YfcG [Variovorax sp. B2]VTV13341.1 Disulfide-bond oxidoreductase YfcG [Variovorax sp. WDL1]